MLDRLLLISLILNATGLYRFVAPQLGVPLAQVSLALLAFNIFYLVARIPIIEQVLLRMGKVLIVIAIWPLATAFYTPELDLRTLGLIVYYATLFCATVVYTLRAGFPAAHRMLSISCVLAAAGMVLSMFMPGYFADVARLVETNPALMSMGRAYGFQMAPNKCGLSLCLLFIGWLSMWKRTTILAEPAIIVGFLLLLLLTGSRTALLGGVMIVGLHLLFQLRIKLAGSHLADRFSLRIMVLTGALIFGAAAVPLFIGFYASQFERQSGDVIDRMTALLEFEFSPDGDIRNDISMNQRLRMKSVYMGLISEHPWIGHGVGTESYNVANAKTEKIAHSALLTSALEYGWLYPCAFIFLMVGLYMNRSRSRLETLFGTNSYAQFVAAFSVFFLVGASIPVLRLFYVVWGVFFAAAYYPHLLFKHDPDSGRLESCMSKREIRNASLERRRSLLARSKRKGYNGDPKVNQLRSGRAEQTHTEDTRFMKPLHVLQIIGRLTEGGMERRMGLIATGMAEKGNAVHIAYLDKGAYGEDVELDGVARHAIKTAGNYDVRMFLRLLSLTRRERPDVIQTWGAQMDICGGIIAYVTKTPWILTEPISMAAYSHTQLTWKDGVRQYLARRATVVANSFAGEEYWRDKHTFRNEVIRNGQQVQRILDTPAYDRAQLPVSDDELILFHVGRFSKTAAATKQKNFQTCLDTISRLSSHTPPVKLLVCGDGVDRDSWEHKVAAAGLENKVAFLGRLAREDVWGVMKLADALLSLSLFEGCPNVVQEAMLCRCPLVVSDIPEHREILADNEALLVDPHSPDKVSHAVVSVLSDKTSAAQRAGRACEKASSWTVEHMVGQYEELYRDLINNKAENR